MRFMAVIDNENKSRIGMLRASLAGHEIVYPRTTQNGLIKVYIMEARAQKADAVIVVHSHLLKNLIAASGHPSATATLNDYRGSIFEMDGMKFLVLDALKNIYAKEHGKFVTEVWVNKITQQKKTPTEGPFNYVDFYGNEEFIYQCAERSLLTGVDIETVKWPIDLPKWKSHCNLIGVSDVGMWAISDEATPKKAKPFIPLIDMVGYTFIFKKEDGSLGSISTTVRFDIEGIAHVRKLNNTAAPKVMQNGGYDSTYFVRFGCPLHNYIFDTFTLMHAWYSELPRDLGFISSLFLKNHLYWKDEIDENRMEYCAKDTYSTAWAFLIMQRQAPTWARENYKMKFKHVFLNLTCGLEGFKVDLDERLKLLLKYKEIYEQELAELRAMVHPQFNPASSDQCTRLFQALSDGTITSSDKITMKKLSNQHPLLAIIIAKINLVRESKKKISTYINADLFNDRLLFEINSSGTETGRDASKASNLWVGTQAQNLDNRMRSMYIADDGWVLCASDGSQAESRTTAYISRDEGLIESVETSPDFHSKNCSLFFGIPFEKIWDTAKGKTLDKALRDLSKRVNHGANYNMTEYMLLLTMGAKYVREARDLLGLSKRLRLTDVCKYLLSRFDLAYPNVRGRYYDEVIAEVQQTGKLVTPCEELPWTRLTFRKPSRDKADKSALNELVASKPQGLSALIIREGAFDFFMKWQIERQVVRMKNLVHDEVQYQIKEDSPFAKEAGHDLSMFMSRPYTVFGRTLVIPCGDPIVGKRLSEVKG